MEGFTTHPSILTLFESFVPRFGTNYLARVGIKGDYTQINSRLY